MIPVAATDPRIKATVIVMPFISGLLDSKAWSMGHAELLWKERKDRASGQSSSKDYMYVPIFPESLEAAQKDPQSTVIGLPQIIPFQEGTEVLSDAAGRPWDNKVTLQTLFHQRRWEPTVFLSQITTPFLYITAKDGKFTPHDNHMDAYPKIQAPEKLLTLESENLAAFVRADIREQLLTKLTEFLKNNL